jgi:hypothetical protein
MGWITLLHMNTPDVSPWPSDDEPLLSMAVLCERVLQESDGVPSLIRVIDQITRVATGGAPGTVPATDVHVIAALAFKSGPVVGQRVISIRPMLPTGGLLDPLTIPVIFEGGYRGANIFVNLAFRAEHEGIYWFDVLVGDRLVTRMPLRVEYQPPSQSEPE